MQKYSYENVFANQNITAKTNVAWVADITEIKLYQHNKLYVFVCVDVHSNVIIANSISRKNRRRNSQKKKLSSNPMEVAMTSPHVVIFTNEKFEDYEKYLSRDRWMSYVITPDKALAARKWDTDMHQWVFLPVSSKIQPKGE